MYAAARPTHERHIWRTPSLVLAAVILLLGGLALAMSFRSPSLPGGPERETSSHILNGAFLYQQQRPLSCEYASTTIAASMAGHSLSEFDFDALVPLDPNPHLGYRGDIYGDWGNTTDYGVYNEPLHTALTTMGIESTVIYANGNAGMLKTELNQDRPVVVWLAMRGDINSFDEFSEDGTRYQLTQWLHVMTVYGYDESGVYLTDPGTAIYRFYTWDEFMGMWNVMDGMALSIHP